MDTWAVPIYVILAISALCVLFAWWKYLTVKACPVCCYPTHRCECNYCQHHQQSDMRWSQDGWVTKCHDCQEILYHGDDYDRCPR